VGGVAGLCGGWSFKLSFPEAGLMTAVGGSSTASIPTVWPPVPGRDAAAPSGDLLKSVCHAFIANCFGMRARHGSFDDPPDLFVLVGLDQYVIAALLQDIQPERGVTKA